MGKIKISKKAKKNMINKKVRKNRNKKEVIDHKMSKEVVMMKRNKGAGNKKAENKNRQGKDVLINYVSPKRFTRNSDQKFNMPNTVSYADLVMKVMLTMIFASFVNKFTRVLETQKMMINGSVVMNVIDGTILNANKSIATKTFTNLKTMMILLICVLPVLTKPNKS